MKKKKIFWNLPVRNKRATCIVDRPDVSIVRVQVIQIGHWLHHAIDRHRQHLSVTATEGWYSVIVLLIVMLALSKRPSIDV